MPAVLTHHRARALSERRMAKASATGIARIIHRKLAVMHTAVAHARLRYLRTLAKAR